MTRRPNKPPTPNGTNNDNKAEGGKKKEEEDPMDHLRCEIIPFLRGLVGTGLALIRSTSVENPMLMRDSELIFFTMLDDAVKFCNDRKNERRKELKACLDAYCAATDANKRQLPLANALNAILKEFRSKKYKDLPVNAGRWDKEEVIFMPNSPTVIKSEHAPEHLLLKPDVVAVFLAFVGERHAQFRNYGFEKMAAAIADGSFREAEMKDAEKKRHGDEHEEEENEEEEEEQGRAQDVEMEDENEEDEDEMESLHKAKWLDIHQPWKLRSDGEAKLFFIEKVWTAYDVEVSGGSKKQQQQADSYKRKRSNRKQNSRRGRGRFASRLDRPAPRPTSISTASTSADSSSQVSEAKAKEEEEKTLAMALELESNFYAAERLSAVWYMDHCTTVLIEDALLTMRWYDAQGDVTTEPFNILEQLPIFVLLVVILQRFDSRMWGMSQRDASKVVIDGQTFLLEEKEPQFALAGRRTFGTNAKLIQPDSSQ